MKRPVAVFKSFKINVSPAGRFDSDTFLVHGAYHAPLSRCLHRIKAFACLIDIRCGAAECFVPES